MKMIRGHRPIVVLFAILVPTGWACSEDQQLGHVDGDRDAGAAQTETGPADAAADIAVRPTERPPFDPADEPVTCASEPCAVELVAGEHHFCARMNDGAVRCWGNDASGALGGGSAPDAGTTGDDAGTGAFRVGHVTDLTDATQLSAGGNTTCALRTGGVISCWGANDAAQLGLEETAISDTLAHPYATPVALAVPATRVDVGPQTACAIAQSGETWCWGNNVNRQLGRSETADIGAPALTTFDGLKLKRTWHGTYTSFGLTDGDALVSWGAVGGPSGSVSARAASISPDPAPLPIGVGSVTSFSVSSTTPFIKEGDWLPSEYLAHACAISKGEVWCWGESHSAALATGLPDKAARPTSAAVDSLVAYPQRVTAAGETTCVRLTDGTVQCAGDNHRGTLGCGEDAGVKFSASFVPATVFTGHAVQIAASASTVCALVQGGTVECWGSNAQGELGQGTTDLDPHSSPVPVSF